MFLTLTAADAGKTIPLATGLTYVVTGDDSANTFEIAAGAITTISGGGGTDVIKFLGSSSDYTVALSGTNAVFTRTADGSVVTIPVQTAAGGNADTVQFGTGAPVVLSSTGSTVSLGAQTIAATSSAVTGATGTAAATTVTPTPTGSFTLTTNAVAGVATAEGNTITLTVTPTAAVATATTLNVNVTGQALGAYVAGQAADFGTMPSVSFAAGATAAQTVTFTVASDTTVEGIEAYKVSLLNSLGVEVANTLTGIINDSTASTNNFTLTTGVDTTLVGGAGDDTFNGLVDQVTTANQTMNATDIINGGGGTDTLNVTGTGTTLDVLGSAQVSNFEIVNIRASTANSLNASLVAGSTLSQVNSVGAGTVLVTNLRAGSSVGLVGNGSMVQGELAFAYATATSPVVVNISGGTAQTAGNVGITAAAAIANGSADQTPTTATINSTGAANTTGIIDLANATLTSVTINATTNLTANALSEATNQVASGGAVTITGAGLVTLSTILDNDIAKIDASTNTGGLVATLGTLATIAVTGSTANDTITAATALTGAGKIDGGAGTDILVVPVANIDTAAEAARFVNFETVRTNGTLDMTLSSPTFTAVQLTAATNSITNMTATQAANVQAFGTTIGATTFALQSAAGTSDVLNLKLGTGSSTAAAAATSALTVTGFETLNLIENGGPTAASGADRTSTITGAIVDANLKTVNLTGRAFTFTDVAVTNATAGVTFDGSALTGNGASTSVGLTLAGSAVAGSTFLGSSVADAFTIGAEGSTYNGNAGNDSFIVTTAVMTPDGASDLTVAGGAGTDTLQLTTFSAVTDIQFTNVTGMEKLVLDAVSTATTTVSATGIGAAAKAAFPDGMTVTSGTLATNTLYTFGAGLYDKAVNLTLVASSVGTTTGHNISVTTGAGADTVSVTAASWVGVAAGTGGTLLVSTGAGNDTIYVETSTQLAQTATAPVSIVGGLGADTISSVGVNVTTAANVLTTTYGFAAGDSLVTAYDSITGFDLGTGSLLPSTLDFPAVGITTYSATAATGYSAAELAVAVASTGLVTFSGTLSAGASLAQKIAAVQSVVITTNGDSALFTHGANSYVFNNSTTTDSLVELIGITGTTLLNGTAANANSAGSILIV